MQRKFLFYGLLVVLLLQSSTGNVTAVHAVEIPSNETFPEMEKSVFISDLEVSLGTASGKSSTFKPENGV